jgi:thymidine kinase
MPERTSEITAIFGGMFAGKTSKLIEIGENLTNAGVSVQAFNHCFDHRYATEAIGSHNGKSFSATSVSEAAEILNYLNPNTQVVIIDEAQFFEQDPIPTLIWLSEQCKVCGAPAQWTQRKIAGIPAEYGAPVIMIGAEESYSARCTAHHEGPGRPW